MDERLHSILDSFLPLFHPRRSLVIFSILLVMLEYFSVSCNLFQFEFTVSATKHDAAAAKASTWSWGPGEHDADPDFDDNERELSEDEEVQPADEGKENVQNER